MCNLLFINRYMRPEGPLPRLAAAHRTTADFYITISWPGSGSPIIVGHSLLLLPWPSGFLYDSGSGNARSKGRGGVISRERGALLVREGLTVLAWMSAGRRLTQEQEYVEYVPQK